MAINWVTASATILEVAGVIILAREVWLGHKVEHISRGMNFMAQTLFLHTTGDYAGVIILSHLELGESPEAARQAVTGLSGAKLKELADLIYTEGAAASQASVARWNTRTIAAAARRRKLFVTLGAGLLVSAALIHFLASLGLFPAPAH